MSPKLPSTTLRTFVNTLREQHLEALARENLRILDELDVPLFRQFAHVPAPELLQMTIAGLRQFLSDLESGRGQETTAETLRLWEADQLPGIPRDSVAPEDLVLVNAAQEQALYAFLPSVMPDAASIAEVVSEMRAFYVAAQAETLKVFTRLREAAAERSARLEAERETALASAEEFQALNEELQAQQEELSQLYEQLKHQHELIEAEVARRTEELQAANEELTAQGEELEAQHEEIVSAHELLQTQARDLAHSTRALELEKAFIETIVNNVPTGIAYLDRERVFRWVNPEFASFSHQPVEAFAGRGYDEVFPGMAQPNLRLEQALTSGQIIRASGTPVSYGGQTTYWDLAYVPVFEQGAIVGVLLLSQDATVRVRHEQLQQEQITHLQQVDRLKDEFLGVLSHELRTPINAIMGFASILDDEIPGPLSAEQHRYMQRILQGSDVLLALIDDLLDMSRIQAGKFALSPAPMVLAQVAESVVATLAPLAERKQLAIALEMPDGLPEFVADAQRVGQVLTNLVGNAIKFSPEHGGIAIRARVEGARIRCEVQDHGEGIAEADIPKLFRRFTQLDGGNTRKAGGTGLGLSIVKALVEAHGGEVGVHSVAGQGATFWFALPLSPVGLELPAVEA